MTALKASLEIYLSLNYIIGINTVDFLKDVDRVWQGQGSQDWTFTSDTQVCSENKFVFFVA